MVLDQIVEIGLAPINVKYYEDLGYRIPRKINKYGKLTVPKGIKIKVNVFDLQKNSNLKVKIRCDYCELIFIQSYKMYNKLTVNGNIQKACCENCSHLKLQESLIHTYGVNSPFEICVVREKSAKTMKERYGVGYSSQIPKNRILLSKTQRLDFEEVLRRFNDIDLIILIKEDEYRGNHQLIPYTCKHHPNKKFYTTMFAMHKKARCPDCHTEQYYGDRTPNWKGGVTELNHYLRDLLSEWKYKSLEKHGFKCAITRMHNEDIQIHHLTSFNTIVSTTLNRLSLPIKKQISDYTKEELESIKENFLLQHEEQLGVPLRRELHTLFHNAYGYGSNTPEQFDEFKIRYRIGEFSDLLNVC